VQRTIFDLRRVVEDKLNRLPLSYFDARQRGEVLSRVTNDIDNVSTSLQQTMSQLITSILTVVGVVVMMIVVSPLLAVIALVTIPVSLWLTRAIGKRSQKHFVAQWRHTGALNGQIEEAFTGTSWCGCSGVGTTWRRRSGTRTRTSSTRASARSSSPASSCRR
jgi:ATP-binding cassette subfamily B protein